MAYKLRHRKKDGGVRLEINDADGKVVLDQDVKGALKGLRHVPKQAAYNFSRIDNNGKLLSAKARMDQIRDNLSLLRKHYNTTKGWTRGRTMKHVARIPAEIFWSEAAEKGPNWARDRGAVMKLADEWGCRLSD